MSITQPSGRLVAALLLATGLVACGEDSTAAPASSSAAAANAPARAAPGGDWLKVIAATPEGGFRIGNPAARVKLVEYASFTCPHCADFHAEALDTIRRDYVATGNVSYEFRNFVLNAPDFAASLLARCQGPAPFFRVADAMFSTQRAWLEPFAKLSPEEAKRLQALPQDKAIAALADAGGLDDFMKQRGMTRARFDQCLADKPAADKLAAMREVATGKYQLGGTPSFLLNDEPLEGVINWTTLEPRLRAAVAG